MNRRLASAVVVAVIGFVAVDTRAQESRADQLYREADALMEKGEYAAACAKLAESEQIDPSPGTKWHLAACHEKNGKLAEARDVLRALLASLPEGHEKVGEVRERLAEIEKRLGAEHGDSKDVDTAEGDADEPVAASEVEPARPVGAARDTDDEPVADRGGSSRTLGYIALGIGAAAFVGVGVIEAQLASDCDDKKCPSDVDVDTRVTIDRVLFGLGLVGVGVGAYILISDGGGSQGATAIRPVLGPSAAALSVTRTF